MINIGVSAGYHKGNKGKVRRVIHQKQGINMGFQVVNACKWKLPCKGKGLGKGKPDEKGADKPWPLCGRNPANI